MKVCSLQGVDLKSELNNFLRMNRNTPSRGPVISSYDPRTDFPCVKRTTKQFQEMKKYNERYKLKAKEYADQSNNHRESSFKEGDADLIIIIINLRPRKADPLYFDQHFTVLRRNGNHVELEADGRRKWYEVQETVASHLKGVPNRNILKDCDKYKEAVCNQDMRFALTSALLSARAPSFLWLDEI